MAAIDFPNSPTLNQEFTANGRTWIWNGTVWANKVSNTSVSRYNVSDTAPTSPANGDVWFNSTNARTYVYYDSFWVESNPALDGKSGVNAVASPITNSGTQSAAVLGLDYNSLQYGQNAVINGGFDIWQRGTAITPPTALTYLADRWATWPGVTSWTFSRISSGLTGIPYAARIQRNAGTTALTPWSFSTSLETNDSIQFAGKTLTMSFYLRAGANYSSSGGSFTAKLGFGTGTDQNLMNGFTGQTVAESTVSATTSWQRFSFTGLMPSNATQIGAFFTWTPTGTAGANDYIEITGIQLEAGSTATPFKRAAGTIQGELAACQRYYYRALSGNAYGLLAIGSASSTTTGRVYCTFPVQMRAIPSSIDYPSLSLIRYADGANASAISTIALGDGTSYNIGSVDFTAPGGMTSGRVTWIQGNNSTSSYLGFNAEL
jgi:hypothetical protein